MLPRRARSGGETPQSRTSSSRTGVACLPTPRRQRARRAGSSRRQDRQIRQGDLWERSRSKLATSWSRRPVTRAGRVGEPGSPCVEEMGRPPRGDWACRLAKEELRGVRARGDWPGVMRLPAFASLATLAPGHGEYRGSAAVRLGLDPSEAAGLRRKRAGVRGRASGSRFFSSGDQAPASAPSRSERRSRSFWCILHTRDSERCMSAPISRIESSSQYFK